MRSFGDAAHHNWGILGLPRVLPEFTSNIGSEETMRMENAPFASVERTVQKRVGDRLRPELLGRVNEISVFSRLSFPVQREFCEGMIAAAQSVFDLRQRGSWIDCCERLGVAVRAPRHRAALRSAMLAQPVKLIPFDARHVDGQHRQPFVLANGKRGVQSRQRPRRSPNRARAGSHAAVRAGPARAGGRLQPRPPRPPAARAPGVATAVRHQRSAAPCPDPSVETDLQQ